MKRRLTEVEWESVCERADERRAAGGLWHLIEEELAGAGVCDEDLDELPRRHRQWSQREKQRQARVQELPPDAGDTGAPERLTFSCASEETRRAVLYICGDGLLAAKPVWRRTVNRTLSGGDRVEIKNGPGPAWMVCAVIIHREDGAREVLAEHRVRQRMGQEQAKRWSRSRGERLRMEVLDLEEGFNTQGIVRRVAAVIYGYFSDRSGVKNGSHLAKLSGVSRQAVNTTQQKVRAEHRALTGKSSGLAGQVPSRRPKRSGHNGHPDNNPITKQHHATRNDT